MSSTRAAVGTEYERVQDAAALGAAEGAAEKRADKQRAQLLSLSTSQITLNYTPQTITRLHARAEPLMIGSTTPRHYCILGIYAHDNTNLLGSFQIWWVPGKDNLFICGCHYPVGVALPDFVVDAVAARHMHAQAGAAEVRPGGGHDVPEHNNDPPARADSNSMSDNPAQGSGEAGGGDDEDLTEALLALRHHGDWFWAVERGDDVPEHNNDPAARAAQAGEEGGGNDAFDPEVYLGRAQLSPFPSPRTSEKSFDADPDRVRESADDVTESDTDDVAGARTKYQVRDPAQAGEEGGGDDAMHEEGGGSGEAGEEGSMSDNPAQGSGEAGEEGGRDVTESDQAQRSSAGNSSSDWRALEQQVLAVEEALCACEAETLNRVSELVHHREAQNSSANDDADSDEAGADVAAASRAGVPIAGSLAQVLRKIHTLNTD
jgi:hypothetical protein